MRDCRFECQNTVVIRNKRCGSDVNAINQPAPLGGPDDNTHMLACPSRPSQWRAIVGSSMRRSNLEVIALLDRLCAPYSAGS